MKKFALTEVHDMREEIDLSSMVWPISIWTRLLRVPFNFTLPDYASQEKPILCTRHLPLVFDVLFFVICTVIEILTFHTDSLGDSKTITGSWNETISTTIYFTRISLAHLVLLVSSYVNWPRLRAALHEPAKQAVSSDDNLKKSIFTISLLGLASMILVKKQSFVC